MNRKLKLCVIVGWLILASLLATCAPRVEEVEVTRIVEQEVVKEVPMPLQALAEKIRTGEIDVGEEYGMAPDQRFHQIHATTIGMECTRCHVTEALFEVAPPPADAPGPVDRRICTGCHMTGPASKLYVPQE